MMHSAASTAAQQAAAEKIYKCGHCGATNDSLDSLKQHMVDVHMPSMQPQQQHPQVQQAQTIIPVSTATMAAQSEDSAMSADDSMTQSSFDVKKKSTKFKCGHCGHLVTSLDELRSHMVQDHVDDTETAKELASSQNVPEKARRAMESTSMVEATSLDESNDGEGYAKNANKVELNFSVMIPDSELHVFPRHVEPVLYFTCKYCDFKGKQYKSVSDHVTACHPKKLAPSFRALRQEELRGVDIADLEAAGERFGGRTRVSRPQPYACGFCNLSFETQVDQDIHQRCHVGDTKAMRCCFCQRDAPEHRPWKMLYRHIVTMHPGNMSPKHLCKFCGVACMFPHNLKIHLKSEHGIQEEEDNSDCVTCEHCDKTFKHSSYLKYHLVIRHGIGSDEDKQKITAQSMRKREQKLINKKHKPLMQCKHCAYQTNDQYRLRTHTEVVHQGVKRHKCSVCNTAFSDYSTLRRHMWRHKDSKPYSCQFCGFTCIQSTQIKSHYKNKHGMNPMDAKKLVRHVNGPRHSLGSESNTQEIQIQITQPQHHQGQQVQAQVAHQQPQHQQMAHHQAIVHQVHQVHQVQAAGAQQAPHRTYTLYNEQGMEYTDIQALADAAEGLLAAEQIVIATS